MASSAAQRMASSAAQRMASSAAQRMASSAAQRMASSTAHSAAHDTQELHAKYESKQGATVVSPTPRAKSFLDALQLLHWRD
jgi:hypothetical protein